MHVDICKFSIKVSMMKIGEKQVLQLIITKNLLRK